MDLSYYVNDNIKTFKDIFKDDNTFISREIRSNNEIRCGIFYIDGMVNGEIIDRFILMAAETADKENGKNFNDFKERILSVGEVFESSDIFLLIEKMLYGDTVFIMDGWNKGIALSTKGFTLRSVAEPVNESMLFGSHEGFIEGILANTSLIRRRIQDVKLKFKFTKAGNITKTKICLCYIEDRTDKNVLSELEKRLSEINTDAILDSNHIKELIKKDGLTPFDTVGYTERPDTAAARILEGKIAIIVDGSPTCLTVPFLFNDNFQLVDDYNFNFYFTSFSRILRMLSFIFTVTFPAFYVSLVAFHQEMIPTPLLYSISASRQGVPLPSVLEAVIVILIFELLREAGLRVPSNVGQALSIVGGIVIGQAAVEAKLLSAPIVIIIAFTGLTGLMIPRLKGIIIVARFVFLFLSAIAGIYGLLFGICIAIVHICARTSFGLSYVLYSSPINKSSMKDNLVRVPWGYRSGNSLLPVFKRREKK